MIAISENISFNGIECQSSTVISMAYIQKGTSASQTRQSVVDYRYSTQSNGGRKHRPDKLLYISTGFETFELSFAFECGELVVSSTHTAIYGTAAAALFCYIADVRLYLTTYLHLYI